MTRCTINEIIIIIITIIIIMTENIWRFSGTTLENFGRRSPTCGSELPMQLGCTRSCEAPARVQMHTAAQVH